MRNWSRWGLWLLLCMISILAACETANTPSPSAPQDEGVLSLPTRTVKPIVSFTPRFTATPIPSVTLTPSETPPPTETTLPPSITPTSSPTITPTVSGVVQSSQRVNLREGPGFNYAVKANVDPGTELGVLGRQTDANGFDWYEVSYTPEDGEEQQLWVRANLLVTDYGTAAETNSTAPQSPRTPGPTPEPNTVQVLAYCQDKNARVPAVTTADKVVIWWNWYVARPELMQDHLDHAKYEVRLDGDLLENWKNSATEMKQESGLWLVYWYVPVGKLSAGEHKVSYLLSWDAPVDDGFKTFGPGTPNETNTGSCTFTVTEP